MLSATSPSYLHALQNLVLVVTSLLFLPLSTILLLFSFALHPRLFFRYNAQTILEGPVATPTISSAPQINDSGPHKKLVRSSKRPSNTIKRETILVTGVGMTKGLHIARAFHLAHHRVIGADCTPFNLVPPVGRFSRAIEKYYALPPPTENETSDRYIRALVSIIHRERVSLWVSCSGVATALDDARAKEIISHRVPSCTSIQFDVQTTQLLHEKDTFIAYAASLGLPVPETLTVTTRGAVHKVLHESPRTKKRYVLKSLAMNDASRSEINTILPRRNLSETYNHLARLPISESNPWILQQYVSGNREYCTHALVIRGKVKVFVACPSSELLMHYHALPHPHEALSRAMLRFTEEFARRCQQDRTKDGKDFTGHLSFDFLVEEQVTERGVENVLRAIECNPRAHTAVALFQGKQGSEMVQAYLRALEPDIEKKEVEENSFSMKGNPYTNGTTSDRGEQHHHLIHPSPTTPPIYWLANDLITLFFHPVASLLLHPADPKKLHAVLINTRTFFTNLLYYHDGTYETWDPLPAFLLYHVYWPGIFLGSLITGKRWSRVNVSTGKMFGC